MNAAVVKKTQETLGKVIKKPPLMEKLLSKPPFRYLHDIFMEVIRTTGFMKGLYEENEMKSDNVNGKEARMAFLQKAIDVVALVSGEPLAAKPARIVAGHEPEKTNELLQAIGKCCLSKLSSDEAVKRVLLKGKVDPKTRNGSSKSQEKRHREERNQDPDAEGQKRLAERSSSREEKDAVKPKDRHHKSEQKERRSDREPSDRRHRSDQKPPAADTEKSRDREKERENGRSRDKEKDRTRDRQRTRDSHRDKENHKERDRERQNGKVTGSVDKKTSSPEEPQQKPNSDELSKQTAKPVPPEQNLEDEPSEVFGSQPESPVRIPRPASAKGQRRRPKMGDESDSDGDDDPPLAHTSHPQENGNVVGSSIPPDINSSRQMTRPGSARPAPLRVRRPESHTEAPPSERLPSAKPRAPVIMDGKKMSDDEEEDDEQFLVQEAPPPPPSAPENDQEPAPELDSEEEHGGLVKKILEVKKNHELPHSSLKSKEQSLVSEAALLKKREMVTKEVEKLRSFIQGLCRNYQFLAKIMEYTLEDMDAMRAEVQHWRKENKECAEALLQEQRETERVLEPLKAELEELEQQIKDQQDQHYSLKANVLKNEELIQKMLTGAFYKK